MMKLLVIRNLKGLVAVLLMCVVGQASGNASINGFNVLTSLPDIQSTNLSLDYDASVGEFSISTVPLNPPFNIFGNVGNYLDSDNNDNTFSGTFALDFSIDGLNNINTNRLRSFSIVSLFGFAAGETLLAGTVTDFAYNPAIDNTITGIEVLLNITSGFLAPQFGFDVAYVNIAGGGLTNFSLGSSVIGITNIAADTKKVIQVPEPSILVLFTIAGLSFFRKGKQIG